MKLNDTLKDAFSMHEWRDYQQLVISELKRLNENIEEMKDKIGEHHTEIQIMKIKSSLWGTLGGGIMVAITIFFEWLKKKS